MALLEERFAIVHLGGRPKTKRSMAQFDFVEVQLKNFLLRKLLLHVQCYKDLFDLSDIGFLPTKEKPSC